MSLSAGAADPFAISGGGAPQGPPSSPAAAGGAEPVRPIGDINDWFRKLCQSPSGVLYEDNYLQVTLHFCSVHCCLCVLLKRSFNTMCCTPFMQHQVHRAFSAVLIMLCCHDQASYVMHSDVARLHITVWQPSFDAFAAVHEDSPGTNHIQLSTRRSCIARPSSVLSHVAWWQAR